MRAVIFESSAEDVERKKAQFPGTHVAGNPVYRANIVRAMLNYGTFDRYFCLNDPHYGRSAGSGSGRSSFDLLELSRGPGFNHRLEPLGTALSGFSKQDEVIILSYGPALNQFVDLRAQALYSGCPIVGMYQGYLPDPTMLVLMKMILDDGLYEHDSIVCACNSGKSLLQSLADTATERIHRHFQLTKRLPLRLDVIPLGIDVSAFDVRGKRHVARSSLGLEEKDVVLLYFGRLDSQTKCDLLPLLITFAKLTIDTPHAKLYLAGDDTIAHMCGTLKAVVAELALGNRCAIRPDPTLEEKQELFAAADIFLSPSDNLQEVFGVTIVEAMASGLPIVASDWDGYKDLVVQGTTGFLVPTTMPRYSQSLDIKSLPYPLMDRIALARTVCVDQVAMLTFIRTLVDRPDLRRVMGEAGRRMAVERFDWKVVVQRYEDLWKILLEKGRNTPAKEMARTGLFDMPYYQELYAQYPTRFLEEDDYIEIVPDREAVGGGRLLRDQLFAGQLFSDRTFEAVVDLVSKSAPMTCGAILRNLADEPEQKAIVQAHVARLLKYGILRVRASVSGTLTKQNAAE
jgi:D-inositol-3-phosphate glycosyltransferase